MSKNLVSFSLLSMSFVLLFSIGVESIAPTGEPSGEVINVEATAPASETIEPMAENLSVELAKRKIYLVTCTPPIGRDPKAFFIEILTKIIGSEKAARRALFYDERNGNRFAARLTGKQVKLLARIPGVESIVPEFKIYALS